MWSLKSKIYNPEISWVICGVKSPNNKIHVFALVACVLEGRNSVGEEKRRCLSVVFSWHLRISEVDEILKIT